jgi:hypothetical protein
VCILIAVINPHATASSICRQTEGLITPRRQQLTGVIRNYRGEQRIGDS